MCKTEQAYWNSLEQKWGKIKKLEFEFGPNAQVKSLETFWTEREKRDELNRQRFIQALASEKQRGLAIEYKI